MTMAAGPQGGYHHNSALGDGVFFGVLVRKLVDLIVGDGGEVTVGDSHYDILVVVTKDQAGICLFPSRVGQLHAPKGSFFRQAEIDDCADQ